MTKIELPKIDPETIETAEAARERIKTLREAAHGSEEDWARALRREALLVESLVAYLTAIMYVAFDDENGGEAKLYGVSAEVQTMARSQIEVFYIRRNPTEDEGGDELSYAIERTSQFYIKLVPGTECTFGQMTGNGLYDRNTIRVFAATDERAGLEWVLERNIAYARRLGQNR